MLSAESGANLSLVSTTVPELFDRLRSGDSSALNDLSPALYDELRRLASRRLRGERPNHTLQPTALVHEAYLKLFDMKERKFANEVHFLAIASRVMRQVLIDHARARGAKKRSAGVSDTPWTTSLEVKGDDEGIELLDLIELDSALKSLEAEDESLARLIEMRYFGGLTAEETAEALNLSVHVVRHNLRFAQAWLRRKLAR